MEFPPTSWEALEDDDFSTAAPRGSGQATMELLAQVRPNGRIVDHFRVSLGGNALLTACFPLHKIIPWEGLSIYSIKFEFWARDVHVRRNMTTTVWLDMYSAIKENNVTVLREEDDSVVELEDIISSLDAIEDPKGRSGAYRFAVVAGSDDRMWLELQCLPCPASLLQGKPAYSG